MKHSMILKSGLLMTMFLFLLCCRQEEFPAWHDAENEEIQSFFDTKQSRADNSINNLLQLVINTLSKQENLLDAVQKYKSVYGIPLWNHSVGISTNEGYQLFVPVYNDKNPNEIRTIWFFEIYDNTLYHCTLKRDPKSILLEEFWKFDYFTTYALGKEPTSGLKFERLESRAVYECVRVSITVGEGEYAHTEEKGWYCWEVEKKENSIEHGNPDGGGGDGGFDSGVDIGGEDGLIGGGGTTSGSSVAPKAKAIFRNSNMTTSTWKVVEDLLDKIIEDCMGENLYNGLKEKLNGKTLSIQFVDQAGSSFYFDGITSSIKLSIQNLESNHLMHEMFHAFQAYQETFTSYQNATINLEIEAHYAQYLYLKSLPEYEGSKWEEKYIKYQRLRGIKNLDYYLEKNGKLKNSDTNDLLDVFLSITLKNLFTKDPNYSDYLYDSSRKGTSNFTNLQTLTINCDL